MTVKPPRPPPPPPLPTRLLMPNKDTQLNQWVSPLFVREEELKQFDLGLGKKPPPAREIMHRHIFWTQVNVDNKIKMCTK